VSGAGKNEAEQDKRVEQRVGFVDEPGDLELEPNLDAGLKRAQRGKAEQTIGQEGERN
jgi:hypothetical protein